MTFGKRLTSARKARGWSQWDLAGKLEITQRTVSRWESGETLPALSVMESLAAVLKVSLKWLMDGKEEKILPCVSVPLLSPTVAAQCGGGAIVGQVEVEEEVWVPEEALGHVDPERMPFAILARGDCMEAGGIVDGAILVVNPGMMESVQSGDIVVARMRFGELTTKRIFFKRNGFDLSADDPTYRTLSYDNEDIATGEVALIGPVVFILQKPKRRI